MTTNGRILKQALILTITLLIFLGIFWTGRQIFTSPTPTPTVDPRTLLDPIQILKQNIIEIEENDYDFVAQVRNPNTEYGGAEVQYKLNLIDNSNITIETFSGTFYILPGQTKYIVRTRLQTSQKVASANLHITAIDWQELDVFGGSGVDLIVTNVRHGAPVNPSIFYQAGADVYNSSFFDLNMIDIVIVVFDDQNQTLAVNTTNMRTLLSQEQRGFETPWFNEFQGEIAKITVEAYTNLFKNDNFLRTQGELQKFQLTY
jgi:hypothetical protein